MNHDYEAEFEDYINELGDHGSAALKFFELFSVSLGSTEELRWGKKAVDDTIPTEHLKGIKDFLKAQKKWIKTEKAAVSRCACRQRMWFLVQKLQELSAFDPSTRRAIIYWMDICMERTMEGCQFRVESVGGKPAWVTTDEGGKSSP